MAAQGDVAGFGARRRWMAGRRRCQVQVWFSATEKAELTAAARRAGMARAAFVARAALLACRGADPAAAEAQRQVLAEFVRVSGLLRRAGANLNQAVARLNATGQAGGDLAGYAALCGQIAGRVDQRSAAIMASSR